ncbi:MAG: LLM class flavin-dependent oxidoreductase [Acidimicrobiales bacterium]
MRLGLVLDPRRDWASIRDEAVRAEALGFDLVWLEAGGAVTAAALAGVTRVIRVGLPFTCGPHPVLVAEESAVADLVLGGRLVVGLAVGPGGRDELTETVEVVLRGHAPRPFRHRGPRWIVPANRPANEGTETRVRVTPTPAQLELPVWLTGPGSAGAAAEFGQTYLGASEESAQALAASWSHIAAALGPAAARLRRPAIRALADGAIDAAAIVESLRAERAAWGLDVALLRLPGSGRMAALETIAHAVRPRLQLDSLPLGLDEFWSRRPTSTRS